MEINRVKSFNQSLWGHKEYLGRDKHAAALLREFTPVPCQKV